MNLRNILIITFCSILGLQVAAQDMKELSMNFSDENAEKTLEVNIFNANITVKGTDRNDVFLQYITETKTDDHDDERRNPDKAKGMKKIAGQNIGFEIEERNNVMEIKSQNIQGFMNLTIEVPKNINLDIRKQIGQDIILENINGTINAESNIGSITAKQVSGAISASSSTGNITVEFQSVDPESTMQFSTITGDIDLTLPSNLKANLKMRTEWGDVYSDHDLTIVPTETEPIKSNGRTTKVVTNEWTVANMNGGGNTKMICNTKMGSIYLRK